MFKSDDELIVYVPHNKHKYEDMKCYNNRVYRRQKIYLLRNNFIRTRIKFKVESNLKKF